MVIENICSCLFFIVSIISILFRADWINKTKPGRRLRHWFLQTDFFFFFYKWNVLNKRLLLVLFEQFNLH